MGDFVYDKDELKKKLKNCKDALKRCQSDRLRLNELWKVARGIFEAHRLKNIIDARQQEEIKEQLSVMDLLNEDINRHQAFIAAWRQHSRSFITRKSRKGETVVNG
jgi:predicted nuclease with TOPRIM domain